MKSSISKKQLRQFGLLISFCFPILVGWIIPSLGGHLFKSWTLLIGIPFFVLALMNPLLLFYPYKVWMAIGNILGWVNSRIVLGLVFIIVLQPIALIMKIFGYDPLKVKSKNKKSYRENKENYKIDLNRIF